MKAYECMADSSSSCMKGYILYILATDLSHVVSGGFASSTVRITFCKWMFSQCRIAGLHELLIFASFGETHSSNAGSITNYFVRSLT